MIILYILLFVILYFVAGLIGLFIFGLLTPPFPPTNYRSTDYAINVEMLVFWPVFFPIILGYLWLKYMEEVKNAGNISTFIIELAIKVRTKIIDKIMRK